MDTCGRIIELFPLTAAKAEAWKTASVEKNTLPLLLLTDANAGRFAIDPETILGFAEGLLRRKSRGKNTTLITTGKETLVKEPFEAVMREYCRAFAVCHEAEPGPFLDDASLLPLLRLTMAGPSRFAISPDCIISITEELANEKKPQAYTRLETSEEEPFYAIDSFEQVLAEYSRATAVRSAITSPAEEAETQLEKPSP